MSIDRFILRKLSNCREANTRDNLVRLFLIRIHRAEAAEGQENVYEIGRRR
ncbi:MULTISPECIES: hypothetical protein [Paenibacillus]|uniref:hypothetical protein n=1 Tax=Paenibacillus TaxID=44249 RepID=UPI001F31E162|nr:hypothetical protein [Paenibacillus sp. JJ-223]CAH1211276.1 hypothetical protein PAECIP111890_03680 [Paenibacillus sp. JJ-223]